MEFSHASRNPPQRSAGSTLFLQPERPIRGAFVIPIQDSALLFRTHLNCHIDFFFSIWYDEFIQIFGDMPRSFAGVPSHCYAGGSFRKGVFMMKHSKHCPRHTAIVFSVFLCMSCLSAFPVPASAQEQEGGAVCYTLTEMPDGWHYADENGNVLKNRLIPNKRLLPATGASGEKDLPSRYDAREDGLVTSVKKQIGGTCWAYGALGAAESNMIKKGYISGKGYILRARSGKSG